MKLRTIGFLAALGLAIGLAGCRRRRPISPSSRVPVSPEASPINRYFDPSHFRVTFEGNSLTDRETVETYLLYRAAELTVAQGYDWFEMVDRHTDKDKKTYVYSDPFYGPGYAWGYWRPYWSYYGAGFGWRGWDPFWAGPFWADHTEIQTVQKFKAGAEIAVGYGPKPAGDPRVFDARGGDVQPRSEDRSSDREALAARRFLRQRTSKASVRAVRTGAAHNSAIMNSANADEISSS